MKIKMHTPLNRLAFWAIFPLLAVGGYFVFTEAKNVGIMIFGIVFLIFLLAFYIYVFIFKLCVFDYAVFKDNEIELRSPFKLKAVYKYNEVLGCNAYYTSIFENKKYLTFTDKKQNAVVSAIDTSKQGNCMLINKMQVVYVPYSEKLSELLKTKTDLTWYENN